MPHVLPPAWVGGSEGGGEACKRWVEAVVGWRKKLLILRLLAPLCAYQFVSTSYPMDTELANLWW